MKITHLMLASFIAGSATLVFAQSTPPAEEKKPVITRTNSDDPPRLSADTSKMVTAGLPKFDPAKPESKPKTEIVPNPDVLELEKMTITQRPRPRLTPQVMMTKDGFNERLAKERLTQLDRGLNKYTLPLFGSSAALRAREEYDREKNAEMRTDVLSLAKAVEVDNPEQAAELRKQANK